MLSVKTDSDVIFAGSPDGYIQCGKSVRSSNSGPTFPGTKKFSVQNNRYISFLMQSLILVAAVSGCSKTQSSQDYFKDAQGYHVKGDDKSAVIQLKNALQKDAGNGEARYLLGTIYINIGNLAAGEDELHKALLNVQEKDKVQNALGQIYLGRGEFQKIIDEINPTPQMTGRTLAGLFVLRGEAYLGLKKSDAAKTAFNDSLKTVPGFADALLGQARLAAFGNNPDEAMTLVDQVIAGESGNVKAWVTKGDLFRARSDLGGAMKAYRQVLMSDGNNIAAHLSLASLNLEAGKIDAAQQEVDALLKVQPNNLMGAYLQAVLHFRQGKFTAARDELLQVLRSAPDHMPSVLLMSAVDNALGSYEEAQKNLSRFVEVFPNNIYARKRLAETQLKMKQPDAALKTLAPLLNETHQNTQANAIATAAYMQTGEYDKAAQYLESGVSEAPKNALLRTQLGLSRLAGGQTERAVADLEAAAKLDPAQLNAENILALTYLGKKDYDHALSTTQTMIKKEPKNSAFYNLQGAAYVGKKDFSIARKCFETALAVDAANIPAAINLGQLDMKDNQPQVARKRFEDILAIDKNNVQAMLYLSFIASNAGQEKEFVGWLERATKANPAAMPPWVGLTGYYVQQKNQKEALAQAQAAVTANPKSSAALDLLGSTQFATGQTKSAVATFTRLVELVPRSPLAYYRLGIAQAVDKDDVSAATSFSRALALKPDYVGAVNALVALNIRGGKYSVAQRASRNFQTLYPKSPEGLLLEGDVEMAQKHYEQSAMLYTQAQKVVGTTAGAIKLHRATSLNGKGEQADVLLMHWLSLHPVDQIARIYFASELFNEGRSIEATEQYQILLGKNPDNLAALNNLAVLYQKANDPKAEETARHAYKLAPGSTQIMDTLGWILVAQNDIKGGLDLLQKAVSLDSAAPTIHYHYAVALVKAGDKVKARQELKQLLDSGSKFSGIDEAKALLGQL